MYIHQWPCYIFKPFDSPFFFNLKKKFQVFNVAIAQFRPDRKWRPVSPAPFERLSNSQLVNSAWFETRLSPLQTRISVAGSCNISNKINKILDHTSLPSIYPKGERWENISSKKRYNKDPLLFLDKETYKTAQFSSISTKECCIYDAQTSSRSLFGLHHLEMKHFLRWKGEDDASSTSTRNKNRRAFVCASHSGRWQADEPPLKKTTTPTHIIRLKI